MTEPKLVWNPDNVRDVAESVGISALNEEAVRILSQEVEYRVGQLIVEAMRFMRQGKRTILGTQDVTQALKVLDVEPLYGYESTRPLRFGEASLGPGQPLFYIEDEEVDFEKLINAPLPKVPRDISFTAHWLAVEGVQPSIPQNPTTAEARATEMIPKGPGSNPSLAALAGNDHVSFKPLVKHIVSKELILFFDKVKSAILDESPDPEVTILRKAAFESVRSDPGLHQLVPYFVQFVSEKVTHCLNNILVLQQMMELVQAMIESKSLHVDPYATSLAPPILTCLVGRNIGGTTMEGSKAQFHLRDLAASLIGQIARKFSKTSTELQARLARTCVKVFLDPVRSLGELYGAINGIISVGGSSAIAALILPNLKAWEYVLIKAQNERGHNDHSVKMLLAAVVKAVVTLGDPSSQFSYAGHTLLDNTSDNSTAAAGDADEIKKYIGNVVGSQIVALEDPVLNKAILNSKEKF
ncbi:Transcription initiation factor TFIID subunit 6 [Golovinomyces cichoracearum]|uniref:TBP-associated factor 6 n=1 Tax=Golovinomyces cichoracearum TaxID=62708 RepID=A0A420IA99_9PEZI|nr:Transcription initiation factor TFIID subunit 6 [Golovinomyces cichoracearum]